MSGRPGPRPGPRPENRPAPAHQPLTPALLSGAVALASFPFSSTEALNAQYKQRPVLVLNAVGTGDDEALVLAMVTSHQGRWNRPTESDVRLEKWQEIGLAKQSVVRTRRIWTGQSRDIVRVLGPCDEPTLTLVRSMVADLVAPSTAS